MGATINALANYEKKLKELPAKRELNNLAIANLKQETTRLDEIINGANNAIAELYDKGVVFEKYRYFVALASFYEYLSQDAVKRLKGAMAHITCMKRNCVKTLSLVRLKKLWTGY